MTKHKQDSDLTEVEKLKKQCDEYLAGWQRAKADYENYKKQVEREKQEFAKFTNLDLVMSLTPIYDHLKLSFSHLPVEIKDSQWLKGMEQIKKQFQDFLINQGVEEIKVKVGDKFNPEEHEAVSEQLAVSNEQKAKSDKVLEVISNGYKMHDKVILPTKVIVA